MNEDRDRAREEALDCALCVFITERALGGSGAAVTEARNSFDLAALRLVNIICELPDRERPEGWEPDPDARTA